MSPGFRLGSWASGVHPLPLPLPAVALTGPKSILCLLGLSSSVIGFASLERHVVLVHDDGRLLTHWDA